MRDSVNDALRLVIVALIFGICICLEGLPWGM